MTCMQDSDRGRDYGDEIYSEQLVSLVDFLLLVDRLKDLLYWTVNPVSGEEAKEFFERLHEFFNGSGDLFEDVDPSLQSALELLLRIIINHQTVGDGYIMTTLGASVNRFKHYFAEVGFASSPYPADELPNLIVDLERFKEVEIDEDRKNYALVELSYELAKYFREVERAYLDVPGSLTSPLKTFIEISLNVRLPNRAENIARLKDLSERGWEVFFAG